MEQRDTYTLKTMKGERRAITGIEISRWRKRTLRETKKCTQEKEGFTFTVKVSGDFSCLDTDGQKHKFMEQTVSFSCSCRQGFYERS